MKPWCALGIDIGGTKIAIGVVAADGQVLASRSIATESRRGIGDATQRIGVAVRQALQEHGTEAMDVAGAGVGCAGPVNPSTGEIHNPYTLPGWDDVFAAAAKGHPAANRILTEVQNAMAAAMWTLLHTYLPNRIVLGGGLVDAYSEFFLAAARAAPKSARLISGPAIGIVAARLGNRAGMVGAARWALELIVALRLREDRGARQRISSLS